MDFLGELPTTQRGHDYILVVVDQFCKMVILIAFTKKFIAPQVAKLFFIHIWTYFGLPYSIVLDRYGHFLSHFWTHLWEMMDTKLKRSTSFDPQIDGQTEVVNRIVVHALRI